MSIYEFSADSNRYQAYIQASDDDLSKLNMVAGESLGQRWSPPRVEPFVDRRRKQRPRGDFPCLFLGSKVPALSKRAVNALGDLLSMAGEILPLICESEELYVFNCTRFAAVLDQENSEIDYLNDDGEILWVDKYVWLPAAENEVFFRIPRQPNRLTYVTERVAERIRTAGLVGFALRPCE